MPLIFYFESIQRTLVLQVKIVTLRTWMIYQVWNFWGFFAECLMRWDSFLTTSYRLVSRAWTIPLKSRTFLWKAINCYGIDNVFLAKQENNYHVNVINLPWNHFNIPMCCVKLFFFLFKGTQNVYWFIVTLQAAVWLNQGQ